MNHYFDPFAMLVGPARQPQVGQQPAYDWNRIVNALPALQGAAGPNGIMVPGGPGDPRIPGVYPGYPGGFYGGADCGPCGFDLSWCGGQPPGFYRQAVRSGAAAQGCQDALGITSRDQLGGAAIGAGLTVVLTTSPTVPFCISRLIVSRTSAPFFSIVDIRAARISYLVDGQRIPADMFAPDGCVMPCMQLPQLFPGTNISVTVSNNDSAAHHFDAAFLGFPGQGCGPCL